MIKYVLLLLGAFVAFQACEKAEPLPDNPFDKVDYGDTTTTEFPIEVNSISYLQQRVFGASCALPGCHDGNFEPDFRTIQSSYSTLVYHPIVKNDADSSFEFRVVPFDTTNSVLYERITNCCFVNQNDRMPQDNIGSKLPDEDIAAVAAWIMGGAKDMFGNEPQLPDKAPRVEYFLAANSTFDEQYTNNRLDGVRFNPVLLPNNTDIAMVFVLSDDQTAIGDLQVNQLKVSTAIDDFSAATTYNATFLSVPQGDFWIVYFNTSAHTAGVTNYMRYYVNDGEQTFDTEFPSNDLPEVYKTFVAFQVLP